MNKKERAQLVRKVLNHHFPDPQIPLHHSNAFTLLIAVLLSAQSTDAMVNRVTPELFALGTTAKALSQVPVEKIRSIIKPVGLSPTKSRAIFTLSHQLVEKHGGEVPRTFKELEALCGVGHKTASVVLAQAFHIPAFPVDTHIFRCAHRWGLSTGKRVEKVEEDLKKLFPRKEWIILHLQIIYFARKYCPARGHHVDACPICRCLN